MKRGSSDGGEGEREADIKSTDQRTIRKRGGDSETHTALKFPTLCPPCSDLPEPAPSFTRHHLSSQEHTQPHDLMERISWILLVECTSVEHYLELHLLHKHGHGPQSNAGGEQIQPHHRKDPERAERRDSLHYHVVGRLHKPKSGFSQTECQDQEKEPRRDDAVGSLPC